MRPGCNFVAARTCLTGIFASAEKVEELAPAGEIRTKATPLRAGRCEKTSESAAEPFSENTKPTIGKVVSGMAKGNYET